MIKICLWLNIPSIHQEPLIRALELSGEVDIQVRYYEPEAFNEVREVQGWITPKLKAYESYVTKPKMIYCVPEWKNRIHIFPGISSAFCRELLNLFELENINWCHWGERTGIKFASMVRYNPYLIFLLLPLLNKIYRFSYAQKLNRKALGVFSIGKLAHKDFVAWGVNPNKIKNLYYSTTDPIISNETSTSLFKNKKRDTNFIYVGSFSYLKGIDTMLRAFAKIKTADWRLIMVGKDLSNGFYKNLADELNISSNTDWIGAVPSTTVHDLLIEADVLILPSRFDGWGAVLNEAASCGKALISTTQAGAAYHLIHPGKNGFVIKPGNSNELYKIISLYINNPNLLYKHGKYSKELYFKDFTAKRNADRLISALYEWSSVLK